MIIQLRPQVNLHALAQSLSAMHMAWEAKKHPAKNIMKMDSIYTNARQNVTAIK
jgi:hypothetical protein